MKLGCLFGHKWDGCICTRCEQVRDEGHNFAPVPGECIEKCTKCGKEIQKGHTWSRNGRGCKCVICGASRNTDDLNADMLKRHCSAATFTGIHTKRARQSTRAYALSAAKK